MIQVFELFQPTETDGRFTKILTIASKDDAELLGRAQFGSGWKGEGRFDSYNLNPIDVYESIEEVLADPVFANEDGATLVRNYRLRLQALAKLTAEEAAVLGLDT